ncbi:hypothetical protein EYF80_001845 [Liparis tanakae]|uniref:Uncharacterized protein n=1 Tax=Liparis tanakae TaxID=230148 RepID=A0A4Z2JD00_9TELE|nr:hypothetical protein EYF80_001845 [Liparis tanakae]
MYSTREQHEKGSGQKVYVPATEGIQQGSHSQSNNDAIDMTVHYQQPGSRAEEQVQSRGGAEEEQRRSRGTHKAEGVEEGGKRGNPTAQEWGGGGGEEAL